MIHPGFTINEKLRKNLSSIYCCLNQEIKKNLTYVRLHDSDYSIDDDTFSHSPFIGCDNENVFFFHYNVNEFNYKILQSKSQIPFSHIVDVHFHRHLIKIYTSM